MNQTIYIADDDKEIRDLIQGFLEKEKYIVLSFEDGDVLLEEFYKNPADLLVLDIAMPNLDGLSLCNKLRQTSNIPIIFVSARDTEFDKIIGINMGVDDYMIKPFSPMELVARVNSIFRRMNMNEKKEVFDDVLRFGNVSLEMKTHICKACNTVIKLTPTEYALLEYMFKKSKYAVSKEELLKNIWQASNIKDSKVIDDILKRLRKKLKETNVKIVSIWGFGFRLELDNETGKEDI